MWSKRRAISEANKAISEYQSQAADYLAETKTISDELNHYSAEFQQALLELIEKLMGETVTEESLVDLGQNWGVDLSGMYRSLLSQKSEKLSQRDELKTHSVIEERYVLLESDSARLVVSVNDAKSEEAIEQKSLEQYSSKEFQWLYERGCHELKTENSFSKFWKVITLKAKKEKKYKSAVSEQFHQAPLRSIAAKYEANTESLKKAKANVAEAMRIKQEAEKLVAKFDELNAWEYNFEGIVRDETRRLLIKNFKSLSVDSIVVRAPINARVKAAKLHALSKKHEYASNLQTYLKTEIDDRNQRVASISKVCNKWQRNPNGTVRGDKTKWLQGIPAMKKEGTRKRLSWSKRMRISLGGYNDYEAYGVYYYSSSIHHHGFLAYDVFNHRNDSRMPHESFSAEVLPEIEQFREEHTSPDWIDGLLHDEELDQSNELGTQEEKTLEEGESGDFFSYPINEGELEEIDVLDFDDETHAIESMIDDEPDTDDQS